MDVGRQPRPGGPPRLAPMFSPSGSKAVSIAGHRACVADHSSTDSSAVSSAIGPTWRRGSTRT